MSVSFSDESTGPITSWSYDFGDDSTSADRNPTHTYYRSGTYTVSLTVNGPGGSDSEVKANYISVNNPPDLPSSPSPADEAAGADINSDLSWTCSDQDEGDTVVFDVYLDTANPPASAVSTGQSAASLDPGLLTPDTRYFWKSVSKDNRRDSSEGPVWSFTTAEAPVAAFTASPQNGIHPLEVSFTDQSAGPVNSWYWKFGDGETKTDRNPSHTYNQAGTFSVKWTFTITGED